MAACGGHQGGGKLFSRQRLTPARQEYRLSWRLVVAMKGGEKLS